VFQKLNKPLELCVVLNGPPNSGKDTLANLLVDSHGFNKHQMKDKLYAETAKHFDVELSVLKVFADNREIKETQLDMLNGMSPREALIHVSQNIIKPRYGKDYFGNFAAYACSENNSQKAVFSDGGFPEEIEPLLTVFSRVVIFHLHKENASFTGDSRDYVTGFSDTHKLHVIEGKQSMAIRDILQIINTCPSRQARSIFEKIGSQVVGGQNAN